MKHKTKGLNSGKNIMWKLAGIYTLAIVVPGLILSLISIRTARHEEAFIEKQFQTAFAAELTQSVYSVEQLLNEIQKMLDTTAPIDVSGESLAMWDSSVALVNVPFLFKRSGNFIWPDENLVSDREREFLTFNNDFFMDRKSVEVYRKITDEYMETILAAKGTEELHKKPFSSEASVKQMAASDFEQDENVQQKVYSDLKRRGKFVPYRNVVSGNKSSSKVEAYAPQLSTYVTESMRFSQIVSTASSGLIPRLIDEEMMLIYWKKSGQGYIVGCSIDLKKLSEQIALTLPQMLTTARFLTILDQNGKSIFPDSMFTPQQWNKPFAAREISRLLPRWEAVIYLADPAQISSRARLTSLSLVSIAAILFTTILVSGLVLLISIYSEIRLARQKTTFVTNVSHELKTPLTSIRIFAELLKEKRQPDPVKQDKYLGIMISEIERLTRLINNVLDFAKINKGARIYSKKVCDCVELCKELIENQRVRLEHNKFTLGTGYSDTPLPVYVDPEAIKQALLNVISNAEKYSSDEKWIRINVTSAEKIVTIAIADRGIGIDQSQSELIFKEFYRVDDSLTAKVQGTGLGLTITRQILHDHNGDIRYEKNEPSGSIFVITLPLYTESENDV